MHVLDDDDIMGNLFASFGYLNTEKLCFFGSKLPKVTWKLESSLLGLSFLFCVNILNRWGNEQFL